MKLTYMLSQLALWFKSMKHDFNIENLALQSLVSVRGFYCMRTCKMIGMGVRDVRKK